MGCRAGGDEAGEGMGVFAVVVGVVYLKGGPDGGVGWDGI